MNEYAEALYQVADLLPPSVADIVRTIGIEPTLRLVAALGGTSYDFPVGVADSPRLRVLQDILDPEDIERLLAVYGGARTYIPRCEAALRELRNRQFRAAVETMAARDGISQKLAIQQLAPQYDITERWAYEILKPPARPQPGLFSIDGQWRIKTRGGLAMMPLMPSFPSCKCCRVWVIGMGIR